ncbi:MAG: hypothetical protein ACYS8K_03825, partial [Planctomycetota bacterium]
APEQQATPRAYDTRSDVYTFALVVLRCLSGLDPGPHGEPPEVAPDAWPRGLRGTVGRCLATDPNQRPADGFELVEMLRGVGGASTGRWAAAEAATAAETKPTRGSAPERALDDARELVEQGRLEEAVDLLEAVPPGARGVEELLDQIEARQRACRELTDEAVRLAGTGYGEAAMETIEQAERLWGDSKTVMAVKSELQAEAEQKGSAPSAGVPEPLRKALAAEKYATARNVLEKLTREGPLSGEVQQAVRQFKEGRVRKGFLDNIHEARRLYLAGERSDSKARWLEAARWLPGGPERERLHRLAQAAERGTLQLDPEALRPGELSGRLAEMEAERRGGDVGAPRKQDAEKASARRSKRYTLLTVLAAVAFAVGGGLALLWALFGD